LGDSAVSWVPLTRAAQYATEEETPRLAREKLQGFFDTHPDVEEAMLWEYQGHLGIMGNLDLLREQYQEWAREVQELEEQQAVQQQQLAEKALAAEKVLAEKRKALSEKRSKAGSAGGKEKARRRDKKGVTEKKAKKFLP
jgi:hypothetical protein